MNFEPDRLLRLRAFGLSEYASRAYLALLELGTTEARDVSRLAKVPVAKIYSTLEQLHERGLVTVTPETPKKYGPVPFADYVERLRLAREEEARQLQGSKDELSSMFRIVGGTEVNDRGGVTTIRGRRNVVEKFRDLAMDARRDILLLAARGTLLRFGHVHGVLENARTRAVMSRIIVPRGAEAMGRLDDLRQVADVRLRGEGPVSNVSVSVFDGNRALLVHFIPDDGSTYNGKDVAIYTDQAAMAATMETLLENMWSTSQGIGARLPTRAGDGSVA